MRRYLMTWICAAGALLLGLAQAVAAPARPTTRPATPTTRPAAAPATRPVTPATRPVAPATRPAAPPLSAQENHPRGVMRKFLTLVYSDQFESAAGFCHVTNEQHEAVASSLVMMGRSQFLCRLMVQRHLGPAVANAVFADQLLPHDADAARIDATGNRATLTMGRGAKFPLVRVNGRWMISIDDYLKMERLSPEAAVQGLTQMTDRYLATSREIAAGQHRSAEAVQAALRGRAAPKTETAQAAQ